MNFIFPQRAKKCVLRISTEFLVEKKNNDSLFFNMPLLPPVQAGVDERFEQDFITPDNSNGQYAKFTSSISRRAEIENRFDSKFFKFLVSNLYSISSFNITLSTISCVIKGGFDLPLQDHAAEHQIYMETTVKDFRKKIAHLEKLLRSEKARRAQIGMTFRSFFKDTMLEIQQYGAEQRAVTNAHVIDRFQATKRRLEQLMERIPKEQNELMNNITESTETIRKQVDHFLSVDCANESAGCKTRHQVLVDAIGTGAMNVEDEMNVAQKERQNSMDELRDMLRESSQLATKNANRLRSRLEYDLASIKNALTTETIMRELSDTEIAMMMSRQIRYLMQSAKCVNSVIGLEDVDQIDYASESTLKERQLKLDNKLRLHLEQEKQKQLSLIASQQDHMFNEASQKLGMDSLISNDSSRPASRQSEGKRSRRASDDVNAESEQ